MAMKKKCEEPKVKRKSTFTVLGFPFPLSPVFQREIINSAFSFQPRSKDVILSSYPKCDTKYIEVILWKLLYPHSNLPTMDNITCRYLSCLEVTGAKSVIHRSPRLVKTHLPFHLIPFYTGAKYIYIIRNPRDACVAYYEFLKLIDNMQKPFDEYFQDFIDGELGYGDFFLHISVWNKYIESDNVLILPYEQIKLSPRSILFRVAAFLGDHYLQMLLNEENLVKDILYLTDFEKKLKVSPNKLQRTSKSNENDRKGENGKPEISQTHIKQLLDKTSETLKDSSIEYMWTEMLK